MKKIIFTSIILILVLMSCQDSNEHKIERTHMKTILEIDQVYSEWKKIKFPNQNETSHIYLLFPLNEENKKSEKMEKICRKIEKIINEGEIPNLETVGREYSNRFLMITKDCSCKIDIQKEIINKIEEKKLLPNLDPFYYAQLHDYYLINKGEKQKFGTAFKKKEKIEFSPEEILIELIELTREDYNEIDVNRKQLGLDLLKNSLRSWSQELIVTMRVVCP